MEILDLIDKLEAMTTHAKRVPITGRSMIDAERLSELIDQMRMTVPRNIQDAQEILERREQIVNQTVLGARRAAAAIADTVLPESNCSNQDSTSAGAAMVPRPRKAARVELARPCPRGAGFRAATCDGAHASNFGSLAEGAPCGAKERGGRGAKTTSEPPAECAPDGAPRRAPFNPPEAGSGRGASG